MRALFSLFRSVALYSNFFFFFKFLAEADLCAFPSLAEKCGVAAACGVGGRGSGTGHRGRAPYLHRLLTSPSLLGQSGPHREICSPPLPTPQHNCIFLNQSVIMEALLKEPRCCHPFMLYWGGLRHFLCAVSASKLLMEAWELISILRDFNNSS